MPYTNNEINQEVQEVLSQDQEEISFEVLPDHGSSPLNQAVVDKTNKENTANTGTRELVQNSVPSDNKKETREDGKTIEHAASSREAEYKNDAPEQEINDDFSNSMVVDQEAIFELPLSHAKQAADTVLGIANNVMEVGGGFFVKIRKHKEFYEFEEIITVIEKQNEKNVQRIKLDKEDQVLLRPLLIQVLKTKAQKLSPEQQLLGATLSILMKKAQVVMEIRNENEILVERLLDIIQTEKGIEKEGEGDRTAPDGIPSDKPSPPDEAIQEVEVDQVAAEEDVAEVALNPSTVAFHQEAMIIPPINPVQVLEVAAEDIVIPNRNK